MSSKYLLNRLVELNPAKLFKKTSIYNNLKVKHCENHKKTEISKEKNYLESKVSSKKFE